MGVWDLRGSCVSLCAFSVDSSLCLLFSASWRRRRRGKPYRTCVGFSLRDSVSAVVLLPYPLGFIVVHVLCSRSLQVLLRSGQRRFMEPTRLCPSLFNVLEKHEASNIPRFGWICKCPFRSGVWSVHRVIELLTCLIRMEFFSYRRGSVSYTATTSLHSNRPLSHVPIRVLGLPRMVE